MSLLIKYFSITKALSDSFNFYFKNLKLLFPITALVGLAVAIILKILLPTFEMPHFFMETKINNIRNTISYSYSFFNSNFGVPHYLTLILLSIYRSFMTNFCLKIYANQNSEKLSFMDFLDLDFDLFAYLIARLRYLATSIAGLLFFFVPGLIWIPRYYFANYFIIDRKLSVGESFAASSQLTHGVKLKLWLFILIKILLFNIFFSFAPITNILIYFVLFIPILTFAKISIYKQLLTPKSIA